MISINKKLLYVKFLHENDKPMYLKIYLSFDNLFNFNTGSLQKFISQFVRKTSDLATCGFLIIRTSWYYDNRFYRGEGSILYVFHTIKNNICLCLKFSP